MAGLHSCPSHLAPIGAHRVLKQGGLDCVRHVAAQQLVLEDFKRLGCCRPGPALNDHPKMGTAMWLCFGGGQQPALNLELTCFPGLCLL